MPIENQESEFILSDPDEVEGEPLDRAAIDAVVNQPSAPLLDHPSDSESSMLAKETDAEEVASQTEQEKLRQQFEAATRLGRDVIRETSSREDRRLTPYLNQRQFSPETKEVLRNRAELTADNIIEAQRASLLLSLQAAHQIATAQLPSPRPTEVLKRGVIENESQSLQRLDQMLGASFFLAKDLIKKDRSEEVVEAARKIIAVQRRISPDQITTNSQQILQWVEKTIQSAGKRVREHRRRAETFLSGR